MFDPPFFTHHLAHFVASASPKYVTPLKVIFYLLMKNVVKMFLGYSNKRFSLRYHLKNLFCKICLIVNCSLYCTICFLIQKKIKNKFVKWNVMPLIRREPWALGSLALCLYVSGAGHNCKVASLLLTTKLSSH